MTANRHNSIFYGVDLWTVLLYVLIVMAGWVSITSASYDEGTADVFSFSHFYMKQLMWIGVAWTTAVVVLLLDDRFYHMFAYPAYFAGLALLVGALLFGREVNGAKAWFEFGSFRMQPVEFVKIATALALARVMSAYSFSINRPGDLFKVGMVICVPLFIIILQNDTGSGIVLGSFLFVLYREGLNKWLCIPVLLIAALFIFSFLLSPMTMLVSIILVCTLSQAMMNGHWRQCFVYLAALALGSILLCMAMGLVAPGFMDLHACLLTVTLLSLVWVVVYAYRTNLNNIFITVGLFLCTVVFLPTTNYIFNSILKPHQQDRILSFLGIISDPLGTDYNVNQSKIAIGSGGFLGKGLSAGYADQVRVRARAAYRLHLLYRGRRVGLCGDDGRAGAAVPADPAPDAHGRAAARTFRPHLLLLRGGHPAVPCAGERGDDHRADARHGDPAAVHELRRLVAHCLYNTVVHCRTARCVDAAILPE